MGERVSQGSRFGEVPTADSLAALRQPVFAENTLKSAISCWKTFCEWKNVSTDIILTKKDLGDSLCFFIPAARKQNGRPYKSKSLLTIVRAIVRHVFLQHSSQSDSVEPEWKFDHDPVFQGARNVLNRTMATLQKDPLDEPKKAIPFTIDQINKLLESPLLSMSSPQSFSMRLYLILSLYLAERISWYMTVPFESFDKVKTINELRYIEIPVGVDKNHQGGIKHDVAHHYLIENKKNPNCCPLKLLEILQEHRPDLSGSPLASRLFLRAAKQPYMKDGKEIWFIRQPVGEKKLGEWSKTMAVELGIIKNHNDFQEKVTNHSFRATVPTLLFHSGVDEQLIMAITKHKSLHGVRSYKRVGIEQLQNTIEPIITRKRTLITTEEDKTGKRKKLEEVEEISSSPPEAEDTATNLLRAIIPSNRTVDLQGLKISKGDTIIEISSLKVTK